MTINDTNASKLYYSFIPHEVQSTQHTVVALDPSFYEFYLIVVAQQVYYHRSKSQNRLQTNNDTNMIESNFNYKQDSRDSKST